MLGILFIACLITFIIIEFVSYITNLSMNENKKGWLTPKEFKELFNNTNWTGIDDVGFTFARAFLFFPAKSLHNYDNNDELCVGIVKFNGKNYGLYYHTYIYAVFYVRKYYKDNVKNTNISMLGDILSRIKEK